MTGPQTRSAVWGQEWGSRKWAVTPLSYSCCPYHEILRENGQEVTEEIKLNG